MDTAFWIGIGGIAGIAFATVELNRRWQRRFDRCNAAWRESLGYERGFGQRMYDKQQAEIDALRQDNMRLHLDLHSAKHERLTTLKEVRAQ
jgi:hypothetical protein